MLSWQVLCCIRRAAFVGKSLFDGNKMLRHPRLLQAVLTNDRTVIWDVQYLLGDRLHLRGGPNTVCIGLYQSPPSASAIATAAAGCDWCKAAARHPRSGKALQ